MARRRRVSFPTSFGTVSFYKPNEKRKPAVWIGKSPGKRKTSFDFTIEDKERMRKARRKREVVNEVSAKIEEEFYEGEEWEEEYPEIRDIILRAARLAIELWEKRR